MPPLLSYIPSPSAYREAPAEDYTLLHLFEAFLSTGSNPQTRENPHNFPLSAQHFSSVHYTGMIKRISFPCINADFLLMLPESAGYFLISGYFLKFLKSAAYNIVASCSHCLHLKKATLRSAQIITVHTRYNIIFTVRNPFCQRLSKPLVFPKTDTLKTVFSDFPLPTESLSRVPFQEVRHTPAQNQRREVSSSSYSLCCFEKNRIFLLINRHQNRIFFHQLSPSFILVLWWFISSFDGGFL